VRYVDNVQAYLNILAVAGLGETPALAGSAAGATPPLREPPTGDAGTR
jgi:hypothetical protein